jgi:hypothetical protein
VFRIEQVIAASIVDLHVRHLSGVHDPRTLQEGGGGGGGGT